MPTWTLTSLVVLAAFSAAASDTARADDSCMTPEPLAEVRWDHVPLDESPKYLGEWQLPINTHRPDIVTAARVQAQLVRDEKSRWKLRLAFSFPDPKPFGLPFTFQRARLSFLYAGEVVQTELDWSFDCSGPGRGMFPGQSFSAMIDLPEGLEAHALDQPVFQLWGARM